MSSWATAPSSTTTSVLKLATGAPGSRWRITVCQAAANRSCTGRSSIPDTDAGTWPGSSSATATTIGRSTSQPREAACADRGGHVVDPSGEQVAQEVGPVLVLDRGDGEALGHGQRGHRRGPLQAVHVGVGDGRAGERDDPAVVDPSGHDRDDRAVVPAVGRPRRRRLDPEPPEPVERRRLEDPGELVGVAGLGHHPPVRGGDEHRPAQDRGQLGGEVGEVAALEHHRDQGPVHLLAAGGQRGLAVEQRRQHLVEDVVEADALRELDHREAAPVGLLQQPGRHLVEVAVQLDGERGQPPVVELADQRDERVRVVAQRVAGGEQQLVRLHPGQDVGDLHDVEPRDDAVQAARPGQHARLGQAGRLQHLAHAQPDHGLTRTRQCSFAANCCRLASFAAESDDRLASFAEDPP